MDNGIKVLLDNNENIDTEMVILSIGVRPEVKLAKEAGLKIGDIGGISVNEFMQTSNENIYALGDAVEVFNPIINQKTLVPLAGPANKQARIVANNLIFGNKHEYKGTIATSVAKVFDLTIAATGVNSRILDKENIVHVQSFTHSNSHASYYPGAKQMSLKINFDKATGKLFGAQIVGQNGVDKRIDVFSQIIKNGGTIFDLQEFEHAYAPPYNSAKDAVNMAGFVAENIMREQVKIIHWNEIDSLDLAETLLIDVRTKEEFEAGHIVNFINIPLDELRGNLSQLSKNKPIIVSCAIGLRGYVAARILMQSGFPEVYNLSGGMTTYDYAKKA
jgi:rhodanese-related sulfurtransferase